MIWRHDVFIHADICYMMYGDMIIECVSASRHILHVHVHVIMCIIVSS